MGRLAICFLFILFVVRHNDNGNTSILETNSNGKAHSEFLNYFLYISQCHMEYKNSYLILLHGKVKLGF